MATKYSAQWYFEGGYMEGVALFSDAVPREVLVDFIDSLWANGIDWQNGDDTLTRVEMLDLDTGEVVYDREQWDEPDNCDDDCGFDPYMGCYTDDC